MSDRAMPSADLTPLYQTVDAFMAGLEATGVEHMVISPGSRSTPLAVTARRRPSMKTEIVLDERAAAYLALGLAQATGTPVGLICTSGTAAANYLPALVEASLTRVPLVVITADRPPELRGWDAGQTIDQVHLYGRHVREFVQMPVGPLAPGRAERIGYRCGSLARGHAPGPVHVNWPFREPFDPPLAWLESGGHRVSRLRLPPRGAERVDLSEVRGLAEHERGIIVAGPWRPTEQERVAILEFSADTGWPILADPLSQMRTAPGATTVIDSADMLMRAGVMESHTPDVVVRVGATPTSKAMRRWLEACEPDHLVLFDPDGRWADPSAMFTSHIPASAQDLGGVVVSPRGPTGWTRAWTERGRAARAVVDQELDTSGLGELGATRAVVDACDADSALVVASSMPVRDLDVVMRSAVSGPRVFANRGANGIDGTLATAVGVASAGRPTTVLVGDLAFMHDLGGLHTAAQHTVDLTLVVLNNAGGGIFSHLPIAGLGGTAYFDELFRTPQEFDFARAADMVGAEYTRADSFERLAAALSRRGGLRVAEVPLDNAEDLAQLAAIVGAVRKELR